MADSADPTLVLASEEEATAILSMMEGMLHVLKDDGLKGSPDGEDLEDARVWLSTATEGQAYPVRLPIELSAAQQTMLRNAIANVGDQGQFWNDGDGAEKPFTARIENYSGNL
ncbi:hypothetical protein IC232_03765 [Microvirga sp. BT688]|uniref:hypothetical protein n=1 Tax=Microvirga sp. TaxID=1873136 RepID=UPI0016886F7E|nr:hypothetical protein [Microvirga sp.]MBD2745808.1 hypothetical protein [Microvirga sp.]